MPYTEEQIKTWFTHGAHTPLQGAVLTAEHNYARDLALRFYQILPEGPEKQLALDRLQEAVMWANTAISRSPVHGA